MVSLGLLAVAFFSSRSLFFGKKGITKEPFRNSQVLGAAIGIRGDEILSDSRFQPAKTTQPNLNSITAKSFLVYDQESGYVFFERQPRLQLPVASLTKLLSALVVYSQGNLQDKIKVINEDLLDTKPLVGLVPGETVLVYDLLNSMIVGSSNDAAQVLARYVSELKRKNFVTLMNEQAKELGMDDSKFSNPLGFDSKFNYSTAQDLKRLADFTQKLSVFVSLGKKEQYSFRSESGIIHTIQATNGLIKKHPEFEAIKTGYTETAKGSIITKAQLNGRGVVFIVLNSDNREADTLKLKEELTRVFKW